MTADAAGRLMAAEIFGHPRVWHRLLTDGVDAIAAGAAQIAIESGRLARHYRHLAQRN